MNTVYIQLGSNLNDRMNYLHLAMEQISLKVGQISARSSVYESKAWGLSNQPDFLNNVIAIETELSPFDLIKYLLEIEEKLGRIRTEKWSARTIDIDILFYNSEIINNPGLKIPHPHLHERKFVLVPMCELNRNFIHPLLQKSMAVLLSECKDSLEVWEYSSQNK